MYSRTQRLVQTLNRLERGPLSLLAELGGAELRAEVFSPGQCPNCGCFCESKRSPYCGEACKEESAFVRQLRRFIDQGDLGDTDRIASLHQEFWHLLGGGFPKRIDLVPPRVVAQVLAKASGRCTGCGGEATMVDHIRTACNRPINLRAVCPSCSRSKAYLDPAVSENPAVRERVSSIVTRVDSDPSLRESDDPANWDWREFLKRR